MNESILAQSVLDIISLVFRRSPEIAQKCFRIKNLQREEIVRLVALWTGSAAALGLEAVRLVVADDLDGQVPAAYVADPDLSITYYRNNNSGGLVYLETRIQSDEQGLQNLFTLRDSNFLDGSFDDYAGPGLTIPRLITAKAWQVVSRGGSPVPTLLVERVALAIGLTHPEVEPVPVRHFVAFAAAVCRSWRDHPAAIDSAVADQLVGGCLHALDMFPDSRWREAHSDARVKRRLELNARHADLMAGGVDLDPTVLEQSASSTCFLGVDGEPLPVEESASWAALCRQYVRAPADDLRRQIPYAIFEQLFKRDTAGLKLGDRVRSEIEGSEVARLSELDAADVVSGLNARLQQEAERFLGLAPPAGLPPLADLLTSRTRKAVERLAAPPTASFFNPMTQIVRTLQRLRGTEDRAKPARMELNLAAGASGQASLGLFTFLFGSTLVAISDALRDVPGACELVIGDELAKQHPVPSLESDRDDDDEEDQEHFDADWQPFSMRIIIRDAAGQILDEVDGIQWAPPEQAYLALFWFLVAAPDSPAWSSVGELWFEDSSAPDDWLAAFVQRSASLECLESAPNAAGPGADPTTDELILLRTSLRESLRADGLSSETLNSFIDTWQVILGNVRVNHVPDGSRPPVLQAFLGCDTLVILESARRLMLPLHPIRLRWISRYLERCAKLACTYMSGRAGFIAGDGEQYLDWLESLSPHESPPTASGVDGEVVYARTEIGWFEEFAPLERVTSDVSVDLHALMSIGARVVDYLDAHPHKRDGLSLLMVLPPSDEMPAALVRFVARGALSDLRVSLTVAAPKSRWERIARLVEGLPAEERGTARGRLFPARDLAFVDYAPGSDLGAQLDEQFYDIAIVTHVLQESITSQPNTEPPVDRVGAFDPVIDRPIRLESAGEGGAISVVMRPRGPDFLLEAWGTLIVRANRARPVSPSQPENIDFVELRVNFQDSARIFRSLHERSHWVMTLERHISRKQIESVEAGAPDVLSIETGIGSNGLNTLIVSSHSGRSLIEARLSRKLRKLVPGVLEPVEAIAITSALATRIYDETRRLSPALALRAMGVSRVTEEILGLCIARRVVDEDVPVRLNTGLSAWISLDEHAAWFDGANNVRADMCRITIERTESGELDVDALVLEGKFRQVFDAHGIAQVKCTCEFLRSILGGEQAEALQPVDAEMWRERVLAAIENVAQEAITLVGKTESRPEAQDAAIPEDIRQDFREGRYRLRSLEGLYSACLWESTDPALRRETRDGVRVVMSGRAHVLSLISRPIAEPQVIPLAGGASHSAAERSSAPTADPAAAAASAGSQVPLVVATVSTDVGGAASTARAGGGSAEQSGMGHSIDVSGSSMRVTGGLPVVKGPRRGMEITALRRMYDDVLGCFASHGVSVSAAPEAESPYIEGPASILFKVRAGVGVDPRKLFEKSQALKLKLELDQEQNVSFDIDRGFVTIDVPKRAETRYFVDAAEMWIRWSRQPGSLSIPIGEDRFGELVSINFSSPNSPHLLVAGTTGSGKSEALNTILFGLVKHFRPDELRLILVDPKGTELEPFSGCNHLLGAIGFDDADALALLKQAVGEMQRRYSQFRECGKRSLVEFNSTAAPGQRLPWWLVVLDEYADLTSDPQAKKEIEQELKRLAQKARAAGIHVVIATQKPSAEVISTNLRSNLPAQLALRVKSGTESRVVIDEAGAENLNGKGDALLKSDGRLQRVQCARVDPSDQDVSTDR